MDEYMEALEEPEETGTPDTAPGGDHQEEETSSGAPEENDTSEENDTPQENDTPGESDTLPDEDASESGTEDLIERLDTLIEALTPEDSSGEENETPESGTAASGNGTAEDEPSTEDAYNTGLLESIDAALASMQEETASYQEEILILQDELLTCEKTNITLLIAVGFFAALSCGNHFANSFFERMKVG